MSPISVSIPGLVALSGQQVFLKTTESSRMTKIQKFLDVGLDRSNQ